MKRIAKLVLAGALLAGLSFAGQRGNQWSRADRDSNSRDSYRYNDSRYRNYDYNRYSYRSNDHYRNYGYRSDRYRNLPPGIQKKLRRGGTLPPGQARRLNRDRSWRYYR
jgi:hypothetical protein